MKSHCEWRPIEEALKFVAGVFVWHGGELVEVHWSRKYRNDPLSWCQIESDRYGDEVYKLEPQPKYYLAVVPSPDE